MYLALTGESLKAEDVVHAGLATHFVKSSDIDDLYKRLIQVEYDPESVDWAIRERSSFDRSSS
jgi:3-hydroxyisobutyryl-CoA hydrolase